MLKEEWNLSKLLANYLFTDHEHDTRAQQKLIHY